MPKGVRGSSPVNRTYHRLMRIPRNGILHQPYLLKVYNVEPKSWRAPAENRIDQEDDYELPGIFHVHPIGEITS